MLLKCSYHKQKHFAVPRHCWLQATLLVQSSPSLALCLLVGLGVPCGKILDVAGGTALSGVLVWAQQSCCRNGNKETASAKRKSRARTSRSGRQLGKGDWKQRETSASSSAGSTLTACCRARPAWRDSNVAPGLAGLCREAVSMCEMLYGIMMGEQQT